MITRRNFVSGFGLLTLAAGGSKAFGQQAAGPAVAVTIDDFSTADSPISTGMARHEAILATLDQFKIKAGGFPAGKFIDNETGPKFLHSWADNGHLIGNHTYTHPYFGSEAPPNLAAEIARDEALLSHYSTFSKLFRFPYLAEGKTVQARDEMRAVLRREGYQNAYVTIDTSDWYINTRLVERLKVDRSADIAPYRKYYLGHLWDRAKFYDDLAQRVLGRSIQHTLLIHHNLTTSLFLGDALAMFRAKGWRLTNADEAFAQPVFSSEPNIAPAGQSLIWALAKEHGGFDGDLRYPGEDDAYEKAPMDQLGL